MAVHAVEALSQAAGTEIPLLSSNRRLLENIPLVPPTAPDWGLALGISTADFAARAFTCEPTSLKIVRRFVRETISAWGLDMLADDMTAVVNELTTNAVLHALAGCGDARSKAWLGVARTGGALVCAVTDPSSAPPARCHPEHLSEAGRGLLVVEALASQWGYAQTDPDGKIVWACITNPRC
ncbi:ATP-binding protein [Streptomyces sp. NBC_00343]|uniref:ATP-binding protein n=1 Tax=Streptomyces sp. NBC_00343 TaxID=2975719 RepID=UPI002E2DF339|nr:ATP-binding protein [Streptomyces sp. NBC_00343]